MNFDQTKHWFRLQKLFLLNWISKQFEFVFWFWYWYKNQLPLSISEFTDKVGFMFQLISYWHINPIGQGRQASVAIKTENVPEETEDEGEDLPDSLGVPNDLDDDAGADGIAEFRKTISY